MRKNLVIIILTAGALLAVFFLTFYIHQTNKGKILSQFNENQLQIARQTARQIESYLRTRSRDLRRLSSPVSRQNSDRERITADIQLNYERLKAVQIMDISLLDEKGTVSYSTTAVAMGENHSEDNFFSWARDPVNNGSVWIGYQKADKRRIPVTAGSPASTHIGIFLVTPLYREPTTGGRQKPGGKFAGALMFKVDLEGMLAERSLLFTPLMKLHKLWIMDKDGTLLLQSEHPEMLMKNIREKDETCNQCHASFDHVETMLGKAEGVTEYQVKGTRKKVAAFASMSFGNASWIVVVNAPLDEVTAFVWENLKETLFLLGILVFVLGIAFFLAYRNYREKMDHETAINAILNISLLNINLEELLSKMFEIIISIPWIKVEAKGCIFLVKEKSDVLVMVAQKGLAPSLVTICAEVPFGRCICGRAALTGEVEFVNSVDERHDNLYEGVSPHGHYCVPIKFHDKVLGVLNLYLSAGHRRDNREEEFLIAVTHVMAGIIERKRAEEERQQGVDRLRKALGGTVKAIASMVETRDPYTAGHQRRVADLARTIATEIGLKSDRIEGLRIAGMIHDIGKIAVPAEILSKPTKLTAIEFGLIKNHVQAGYDILKDIEFSWPVARIVHEHHEKIDGSGYPCNLSGQETLIESKILTVADVVEAMASHRPYRPGLGINAALDEIAKNRGTLYEPEIVDACLKLFNEKGYKIID
jgi:putative nucleotidyltransferase with HDIG domain